MPLIIQFLSLCNGLCACLYVKLLWRLFLGSGKEHQHSDAALKAMSATAGRVAGLASIGFAKKESLEDSTADYMNQLETEVAVAAATAATAAPAAADSPDSAAAGAGSKEVPTVGAVASALSAYLGNLENDIRSEKFRQVKSKTSEASRFRRANYLYYDDQNLRIYCSFAL